MNLPNILPDNSINVIILDVLQNNKKVDQLISEVTVPKCPCGKIPLKCPQPNNCMMENL